MEKEMCEKGNKLLNSYHLTAFKKGFDKCGPKKKTQQPFRYFIIIITIVNISVFASTRYARLDSTISQGKN